MPDSEKGVNIEKIVKFASEIGRNYYLTVLAILVEWRTVYSEDRPKEQSPDAVLTAMDGRTYSFLAINVFLGLTCFVGALGEVVKPREITLAVVVPIFVLWTLLAVIIHWIAKLFRSDGTFLETLAVCMRVLSLAFFMAGALSLTAVTALKPLLSGFDTKKVVGILFLVTQVVMLGLYLPTSMRRVHRGTLAFQLVIGAVVVLWALALNGRIAVEPKVTKTPEPDPLPITSPKLEPKPQPKPTPSPEPSPQPTPGPKPTPSVTPSPTPTLPERKADDSDSSTRAVISFPPSGCLAFDRKLDSSCPAWEQLHPSRPTFLVLCSKKFLEEKDWPAVGSWPTLEMCKYMKDYWRHGAVAQCLSPPDSETAQCDIEDSLPKSP
jgi:hypothetical protein